MSIIESFYNNTFDIKRTSSVSGQRYTAMSIVSSGLRCALHPVQDKAQLFNESNFGKEFWLFCENGTDIKANDLVTISSIDYGVVGTSEYNDYFGDDSHIKVVIVKK